MRIVLHGRYPALRDSLAECLRASGHEVAILGKLAALAQTVEAQAADLAAVDLDDPEAGRHVEALRARFPSTGVLVFSSDARAESVVEALRRGAREVLFKPFGHDALARALARALPPNTSGTDRGPVWIAEDPLSVELLEAARSAAAGTATLLITGEIGTGKTQLARFVQALGPRASAPFVEVSGAELCGDSGLAMLVGREGRRPEQRIVGCFERAHTGTLLVEDVDELDEAAERALLEFLDDGRVRPLGSSRLRHFDIRVIATSRSARHAAAVPLLDGNPPPQPDRSAGASDPLATSGAVTARGGVHSSGAAGPRGATESSRASAASGVVTFPGAVIGTQKPGRPRSTELRTRLGVLQLALRPLRERPGDIAPLARHFHALAAPAGAGADLDEHSCAALSALTLPGNATELQNLMRQACVVFPNGALDVARLGAPFGARHAAPHDAADRSKANGEPAGRANAADLQALNLRELEREAVRRSLELARGNRTLAARALGVSTRTLRNKIRAYDLR